MNIFIKTDEEIKKMKISGKLAAEVLEIIEKYIKPGISTEDLNKICHNHIVNKQNAIPACLNYFGYPKSICTSINDVICHGVPNKNEILKEGDIINIDVAVIKNGFHADTSKMFFVGKINKKAKLLCETTQKSLYLAIKKIKPGISLNIIGKTIQNFIEKKNFSIVKEYCGHGIGKNLHENPQIIHYSCKYNKKIFLKKGMTFTIEPIVNIGSNKSKLMNNGWTVKTIDKSLSAQYEHTVLVTDKSYKILTLRKEEKI